MVVLDLLAGWLFRWLSRLRGARVVHPRGVAYEATWQPAAGDPLELRPPATAGPHRAIVRTSRGIGLPAPSPDVLGVAIKVLDAHGPGRDQDLLLGSVGSGRVGQRLLRPARSFSRTVFSTVLPYLVADGRRTPVVALLEGEPATHLPVDDPPAVWIELSLARTARPVATVALTRPLPASVARDLRFDPSTTGRSMRPVGVLNRIRRPVYRASQAGRGAPPDGARPPLARAVR